MDLIIQFDDTGFICSNKGEKEGVRKTEKEKEGLKIERFLAFIHGIIMLYDEKDVKSEDNRSSLSSLCPNCETIRFYIVDLA